MKRRRFLTISSATGLGLAPGASLAHPLHIKTPPLFDISLAEWSLHRTLRGGTMTNLDFPKVSKETFGIHAVEYVNQFFKDKARDKAYLDELKTRCDDLGVQSLLIMVDGEGHLGHSDQKELQKTIDNHKKWVEAAKHLGCHSIRVNAHGHGDSDEEKAANTVKGLRRLSQFAADHDINVIVENHGGLSSNGEWLAGVLSKVGLDNCGSLPDFGNFVIDRKAGKSYDRYQGIKDLMPFAKGVSAKSHDFDDDGNEVHTDYVKALKIVLDAGYRGHVGVEYEGGKLSEEEGIKATKKLLEKVRTQLASAYS
ncbi:MAG: sugar phosphate isomerase/epimerase [Akkermansiaceae bacterium]|nr:sugar phosphate isomerase/epimerase [Akkermansiaceae bacterium]NNM30557.1 sugar phosphate isomerase/epimerase [Akkermansiaceae bacterium]